MRTDITPPHASIARQLVRAIRSRIDEVSTADRHGGEVAAAIRVVLAEAELAPVEFIHRQQRRPRA